MAKLAYGPRGRAAAGRTGNTETSLTMDYALLSRRPNRLGNVIDAVGAWLMSALCVSALAAMMVTNELAASFEAIPVVPVQRLIGAFAVLVGLRLIFFVVRFWIRTWWARR